MRTPTRSSARNFASLPTRAGALLTAAAVAVGTLTAHAPCAYADDTVVSPHGKGIVGGALLGAEAVTIVESVAGVKSGWAYIIGAVLGAGAGGAGGYAIEQNSTDGKAPVYLLAGGLGLVIPALVLSLNATRYMPSEGAVEDHPPSVGPAANPGAPGASSATSTPASSPPSTTPPPAAAPPPTSSTPPQPGSGTTPTPSGSTPATATPPATGAAPPPLSLFDVHGGAMRVGVPVPEIRPLYSMSELRQYGLPQQTEVRMPLVKVSF
jgi:hypothetical protein